MQFLCQGPPFFRKSFADNCFEIILFGPAIQQFQGAVLFWDTRGKAKSENTHRHWVWRILAGTSHFGTIATFILKPLRNLAFGTFAAVPIWDMRVDISLLFQTNRG
jgi:hypothetical protein